MPEYVIQPEDLLHRRFPALNVPKFIPFFKTLSDGRIIPSSAAFKTKPDEDGLSVDIAHFTNPHKTIQEPDKFRIAEIRANLPMSLEYPCQHKVDGDNYAHAIIVGDTNPIAKKLSKGVLRVIHIINDEVVDYSTS